MGVGKNDMRLAEKELKRAKEVFNRKDYPDCIFHSHQAVEKMAKSLLEANKIIVRDHYVAGKLKKILDNEELIKSVRWFEEDKNPLLSRKKNFENKLEEVKDWVDEADSF